MKPDILNPLAIGRAERDRLVSRERDRRFAVPRCWCVESSAKVAPVVYLVTAVYKWLPGKSPPA
jgi:hypothetical protein